MYVYVEVRGKPQKLFPRQSTLFLRHGLPLELAYAIWPVSPVGLPVLDSPGLVLQMHVIKLRFYLGAES